MKIRFYDKKTGKDAKIEGKGVEFFLDANGKVVELREKEFNDCYMIERDIGVELIMSMTETIEKLTVI